MLKAGLQFADAITTVSPTYALEIQTEAAGVGLDGVLRARVHDALGDPLPIEVADLLEELVVLERRGAACSDRPLVLVVMYRMALPGGERRAIRRGDRFRGIRARSS